MSSTRVGTNKKYSENWDNIFGGKRSSSAKSKSAKPAPKSTKKKSAKTMSGGKKSATHRKKRGR